MTRGFAPFSSTSSRSSETGPRAMYSATAASARRSSPEISWPTWTWKKRSTPFSGGASAIGFVASINGFPAKLASPAARSASAAAVPLTASTTSSPKRAASAKPPTRAFAFPALHASSFAGSRVPSIVS